MKDAIQTTQDVASLVESLVTQGDLKGLTPGERVGYYRAVCERVGLDPVSQPFQYITLQGKLTLYATKGAAEQLRRVHGISIDVTAREVIGDCFVVTVTGSTRDGRKDGSLGVVPVSGLKGEALANAMMKAETKAKRRVTLSLTGLGMLDELETESIPGAQRVDVDTLTGEIAPTDAPAALPAKSEPDKPITKAQYQDLVERFRDNGWKNSTVKAYLASKGYERGADIRRRDYMAITLDADDVGVRLQYEGNEEVAA